MAVTDQKWSALPVPYAMELPDRVPKERYYDPDFYAMEVEQLWPRVWQMACRLEEIPQPRDFVEYEFLDQSVIVVRTDDMGVAAFQNTCRHRGVKLVEGSGTCARRVPVPVPRLVLRARRRRTPRSRSGARSPSTTWWRTTSTSCRCGARCGAGARGSTSTTTRRPCASASSPRPRTSTRGRSSRCGPRSGTRAASR